MGEDLVAVSATPLQHEERLVDSPIVVSLPSVGPVHHGNLTATLQQELRSQEPEVQSREQYPRPYHLEPDKSLGSKNYSTKVVLISKEAVPRPIRHRGTRGKNDHRNRKMASDRQLFYDMTRRRLDIEHANSKVVEVRTRPPVVEAVTSSDALPKGIKPEPSMTGDSAKGKSGNGLSWSRHQQAKVHSLSEGSEADEDCYRPDAGTRESRKPTAQVGDFGQTTKAITGALGVTSTQLNSQGSRDMEDKTVLPEWEEDWKRLRSGILPSRQPAYDSRNQRPRRPYTFTSITNYPVPSHRHDPLLFASSRSDIRIPSATFTSTMTNTSQDLDADWRHWDFVEIFILRLPDNITSTEPLWESFRKEGRLSRIELTLGKNGELNQCAKLTFKPPPLRPFWFPSNRYRITDGTGVTHMVTVRLDRTQPKYFTYPSPVSKAKTYPELTDIPAESVDFGIRDGISSMLLMRTCISYPTLRVKFALNLRHKKIEIYFPIYEDQFLRQYRISIPWDQALDIFEVRESDGKFSFILSLGSPPHFSRKIRDEDVCEYHNGSSWSEEDAWLRMTDILALTSTKNDLKHTPISLNQPTSAINIGRWTTYRVTFSGPQIDQRKLTTIKDVLQDFNVPIKPCDDWTFAKAKPAAWDMIDYSSVSSQSSQQLPQSPLNDLAEWTEVPSSRLTFPVRYQLEVCISNRFINEYAISRDFLARLAAMEERKARTLLEHVAALKEQYYDPMAIFDLRPRYARRETRPPAHCSWTRSVTVTASTMVYNTPAVEMTNRVLRQYSHDADYFLRVRFEDDPCRGMTRIYSFDNRKLDELLSRIYRTMNYGITLGNRHYEFLAFGNSQFREHGAYFFAPSPSGNTASKIRAWMGRFNHERIVAKHTARIGQCFSTTRLVKNATVPRVDEKTLVTDVKDKTGKYTFSDGVGKISVGLAQLVAAGLGISPAPSVYQFRLAGCKGILAMAPDLPGLSLQLRRSQYKFGAEHNGLEIIRCSEYWVSHLNRQLILVLSALGINDEVFLSMQQKMIDKLRKALDNDTAALEGLHQAIDPNQMTLSIASLVLDGFRSVNDPFVTSMLRLWRAWMIKNLKEKGKIPVSQGACVLGCMDETGALRGHFDALQPEVPGSPIRKPERLPEIFIQVTRPGQPGTCDVVEGLCVLARNPSLHPGDVRVVRAVKVEKLNHLKDVVVLPRTGDRDLSSMCSGGDLDGDDYIVIWDPSLIPNSWQPPMDYTPPDPVLLDRDVQVVDMTKFFVNYIKNDRLGAIAHAHLAHADYLDDGIFDDKCLELTALHSKAVDYPKTGLPAEMPNSLRPNKFPHFMEKSNRSQYHSKKVLGRLYDAVQKVKFEPNYEGSFDDRILNAGFKPSGEAMEAAKDLKAEYDIALEQLMRQYEIWTEFEVWTTFALHHSKGQRDYKFHEEIGPLSHALKDRFRKAVYEKVGSQDPVQLAPFAVAMYMITQQHLQETLQECERTKMVGSVQVPVREKDLSRFPYISFPWLLQNILGDIATGRLKPDPPDSNRSPVIDKPKQSLQTRSQATGPGTGAETQEKGALTWVRTIGDILKDALHPTEPGTFESEADSKVIETSNGDDQQAPSDLEGSASKVSTPARLESVLCSTPSSASLVLSESPGCLVPFGATEKIEQVQSPLLKSSSSFRSTSSLQLRRGHTRGKSGSSSVTGGSKSESDQFAGRLPVGTSRSKSKIEALLDDCERLAEQRRASRLSSLDSHCSSPTSKRGDEPLVSQEAGENVKSNSTHQFQASVSNLKAVTNLQPASPKAGSRSTASENEEGMVEVIVDEGEQKPSALDRLAALYTGY